MPITTRTHSNCAAGVHMSDCAAHINEHGSLAIRCRARWFSVWGMVFLLLLVHASSALAQGVPRVQSLNIELWPEYDDPRLLVLIAGTLESPNQEIHIPLPEGADINAIAYATEDGRLLTAEWHSETKNGRTIIVVTVPTKRFHVEYYIDAVTSGKETVVRAEIPVPEADIARATLIVQQPANTTHFRGDPPLGAPEAGFGGLFYASRDLGALSPGDTITQEVRYTRLAPGLSTTPRAAMTPQQAPATVSEPSRSWLPVAVGVTLALVIAVAVMVWLHQQAAMQEHSSPQGRSHVTSRPLSTTTLPRYCPNCGHPFGPNDRFCAMCGTKRA